MEESEFNSHLVHIFWLKTVSNGFKRKTVELPAQDGEPNRKLRRTAGGQQAGSVKPGIKSWTRLQFSQAKKSMSTKGTKEARGLCDARGCQLPATERVPSFYPGDGNLNLCRYHIKDEMCRRQSEEFSMIGKAKRWVDTGRAFQKDPRAMGYLEHMMAGGQHPMLAYDAQQMQQMQPQQQMTQYYTHGMYGAPTQYGGAPTQYYQPGQQIMPAAGHCAPAMHCAPAGAPRYATAPIPIPAATSRYSLF